MIRKNYIIIIAAAAVLFGISWLTVLGMKSNTAIQKELTESVQRYIEDEAYIRAIPAYEEAAGYETEETLQIEEALKDMYKKMFDTAGYERKYIDLLSKQMNRKDCDVSIYIEAVDYYLDNNSLKQALSILRRGIENTGSGELVERYEDERYAYDSSGDVYDYVSSVSGGGIQVMKDGLWGLADSEGSLVTDCQFEKMSTYYNGQIIVKEPGSSVISAVNINANRWSLLHEDALDFGNYNEGLLSLRLADGWHRANVEFFIEENKVFEDICMYSNGYAAAKQNGKWGVIDKDGEFLLEPVYDGIIIDEISRCYSQDAVFAVSGGTVHLFIDGEDTGLTFEDARPFDDGYAAVKNNGMWGYIDNQGNVVIDYQFYDAMSFGQHLAAIFDGSMWGYISLRGEMVIEPVFLDTRRFYNGSAAVKTGDGWQFITLVEYE